jgi:glycosyltransferase involved in cell wall biosynthesis
MAPVGLAIAEHWRLPYVQTIDEFLPPHARLRLSRRWLRCLIPVSRELADDLVRELDVPGRLLSVVSPGVAVSPQAPAAVSPSRVPVIGTAGPLVPASGFATFLAAARRVVDAGIDAEFVIAGQGADEVDLRRRADRLKIADRVTFSDQPGASLRFWNVLDVFCQTSIVPTVGQGLLQAMASGVAPIASDIEGLRTLVAEGETGLRVPPGDAAAFARRILDLLTDRDRARSLGARAREFVSREFDPDKEARKLDAVYLSALATDEAPTARTALAAY